MREQNKRTWLMEKRKAAGFKTQRSIAKKVSLSYTYYGQIENGFKNPSWEVASRIAKTIDCEPVLFFTQ
jgi:DNA-binding XRE family transcriptional regulator